MRRFPSIGSVVPKYNYTDLIRERQGALKDSGKEGSKITREAEGLLEPVATEKLVFP